MPVNVKKKKIDFSVKGMKFQDDDTKIHTVEMPEGSIVKKEIKLPNGDIYKSIKVYPHPIWETIHICGNNEIKDLVPSDASGVTLNWESPTFVNSGSAIAPK